MRAVLDTCVLFPPVLREILLAAADAGLYGAVWSDSILDEWRHVSGRDGPANSALIEGEIARLDLHHPEARIQVPGGIPQALYLPDPADIHVLATAIAAGAEQIVTANLRDFPARHLNVHGVRATHPDAFLRALWLDRPEAVAEAVEKVRAEAAAMAGQSVTVPMLLKRARLPRLAKALAKG